MDISDRIRQKMTEHHLRAVDLTKMTGATKGSVSQWLNGISSPGGKYIIPLTKALQCDANWLFGGVSAQPHTSSHPQQDTSFNPCFISKQVPIISHEQAETWRDFADKASLKDQLEWEYAPAAISHQAFWLKVIGDSMVSPVGHSISESHIILVDPCMQAQNGDLVVAKIDATKEVTFKKLIIDAGQTYLKPLNPNYRPIEVTDKCRVIGVVREARLKL
ncbi:S24 family peptidase [Marinomonas posidonica]|uniref:S24 family peptidase n=1 Tax=Marinomonas posidonica TaxID=936476 RepID=UPI00373560C4